MLAIYKQSSHFHSHLIQNIFYHQLMAAEKTLDHQDKAYLLNCHLYKCLPFLFELKDYSEFHQLLHPEISNN